MVKKLLTTSGNPGETLKRSLLKTASYRFVIIILDFTTLYLFTGKVKVALGFTVVSNVYTTLAYFFHERIWDRISWGKTRFVKAAKELPL